MHDRKKPYAPLPGTHPLAESAWSTFDSARTGLEESLAYMGATNSDDTPRMRVALAGIVAACDAFKATANAYSNVLGHVQRAPKGCDECRFVGEHSDHCSRTTR